MSKSWNPITTYSGFIDQLNVDISRDWPSLKGRVVLFKLYAGETAGALAGSAEQIFDNQFARRSDISDRAKIVAKDILLPMIGSKRSDDSEDIVPRSFGTSGDPSNADYFCAVRPSRPSVTGYEYSKSKLHEDVIRPFSSKFAVFFPIVHELGHCLIGAENPPEETAEIATLREETAADVFAALYLRRDNSNHGPCRVPDITQQEELLAMHRYAEAATVAFGDHLSSWAIKYTLHDVSGLQLSPILMPDLAKIATRYAKLNVQQFFPHLYKSETLQDKVKLPRNILDDFALSQVATSYFDRTFQYINDVNSERDGRLEGMSVSRAYILLETADSLYRLTNKWRPLDAAISDLRRKYPEIFRVAEEKIKGESEGLLFNSPQLSLHRFGNEIR